MFCMWLSDLLTGSFDAVVILAPLPELGVQGSKAPVVFWAAQSTHPINLLWNFQMWKFHHASSVALQPASRFLILMRRAYRLAWGNIIDSDNFVQSQKLGVPFRPLHQRRTATGSLDFSLIDHWQTDCIRLLTVGWYSWLTGLSMDVTVWPNVGRFKCGMG